MKTIKNNQKTNPRWHQKIKAAPVASWFKSRLFETRQGRRYSIDGSSRTSYYDLGVELGEKVDDMVDSASRQVLFELGNDPLRLRRWLELHLSPYLELVPTPKRRLFIQGFASAAIQSLSRRRITELHPSKELL